MRVGDSTPRACVVLFAGLDAFMDPRDRLWAELVFPWCAPAPAALMAVRASCRAWRAQLDNSRLWLPFTMELPRMRYDERLAGWSGVVRP